MNFLKWSESNTSSRSYKVGSCRTRLIVPDGNNDDVGEVNEFWSGDTYINSIYNGSKWYWPACASRILEAAESCDSILWEGAPKERRALASFKMNFLLCVISIRREVSQEKYDKLYIQRTFNIFCNDGLPSGSLDKRRNWEIAVGSWWLLIVGLKMSRQSRSCTLWAGTWRSS